MKNIYIIIFLLAFLLSAKSQTGTFEFNNFGENDVFNTSQTFYKSTGKGVRQTTSIYIKNITNAKQTYTLKRTDIFRNVVGPGDTAMAQYCIGPNCYDALTKATTFTMSANQKMVIHYELVEATELGVSIIKYEILNAFNTDESVFFNFKYNDILSVKENKSGSTHSGIYPNPSSKDASININSANSGSINLKILNALGALVSSQNETLTEGKNTIKINTENLPSGVYFLNATQNGFSFSERFVVVR